MKKLMVMSIFVGFASVASASLLELNIVDGEITVGDTTMVEIVAAADILPFGAEDWMICVDNYASLSAVVTSTSNPGATLVNNGDASMFGCSGGFWGTVMTSAPGQINKGDVLFFITLTGDAAGLATITLYDLSGGMVVSDTETVNVVPIECMKPTHPDYATWDSYSKPCCWCYEFQCLGDADGLYKYGLIPVSIDDIPGFMACYGQMTFPFPGCICYDFDHLVKYGLIPVSVDDLVNFLAGYGQTEAFLSPCLPEHFNSYETPETCDMPGEIIIQ